MNAYGPQDWPIVANKVVFDHATVDGWYYIVSIDLKLSPDNLDNASKANIYGLTDGAPFGDPGSEFPAVYLLPESLDLEVCTYLDGARTCIELPDKIEADVWFNLKVEQNCFIILIMGFPYEYCYITVLLNEETQFFWFNSTPETWNNVEGIIGNTYDQENIIAATGRYRHFDLHHSDDGKDLSFAVSDPPTHEDAVNVESTADK